VGPQVSKLRVSESSPHRVRQRSLSTSSFLLSDFSLKSGSGNPADEAEVFEFFKSLATELSEAHITEILRAVDGVLSQEEALVSHSLVTLLTSFVERRAPRVTEENKKLKHQVDRTAQRCAFLETKTEEQEVAAEEARATIDELNRRLAQVQDVSMITKRMEAVFGAALADLEAREEEALLANDALQERIKLLEAQAVADAAKAALVREREAILSEEVRRLERELVTYGDVDGEVRALRRQAAGLTEQAAGNSALQEEVQRLTAENAALLARQDEYLAMCSETREQSRRLQEQLEEARLGSFPFHAGGGDLNSGLAELDPYLSPRGPPPGGRGRGGFGPATSDVGTSTPSREAAHAATGTDPAPPPPPEVVTLDCGVDAREPDPGPEGMHRSTSMAALRVAHAATDSAGLVTSGDQATQAEHREPPPTPPRREVAEAGVSTPVREVADKATNSAPPEPRAPGVDKAVAATPAPGPARSDAGCAPIGFVDPAVAGLRVKVADLESELARSLAAPASGGASDAMGHLALQLSTARAEARDLKAKLASAALELAAAQGRLKDLPPPGRREAELKAEVERLGAALRAKQIEAERLSGDLARQSLSARKWEAAAHTLEARLQEALTDQRLTQDANDSLVRQQGPLVVQSVRLMAARDEEARQKDALAKRLSDLPDLAEIIQDREKDWAEGVRLGAVAEDQAWRLARLQEDHSRLNTKARALERESERRRDWYK
jgi:hypothetical protein